VQSELSFRRAMLVGRQRLFIDAVQILLTQCGVSSVTVVADAAVAVTVASSARPEVVLVDVDADDQMDARLRAGREIAEADPGTVVLAVSADPVGVGQGGDLHGHLSKHVGVDAFVSALDAAVRGERVFQRAPHATSPPRADTSVGLTVREQQVLHLLAEAATGREIATRLGISLNTERTHVRSVLWKLQAHSREEAVAKAAHARLLAPGVIARPPVADLRAG
jgi:two-component system, NarL family, nitrate/nitrite response regulator NarL